MSQIPLAQWKDTGELMTHHQGLAVMPRIIHYLRERDLRRERWAGAW